MLTEFEQLNHLRELMYELNKLEKRREQLIPQINKQEQLIFKLQVQLDLEEEDVAKLMKLSLKGLFYTILRSKDEQLEKERQEALEAAVRLQEARITLHEYKVELQEVYAKLDELAYVPDAYNDLLERKEAALKDLPAYAYQLEELELNISNQGLYLKELKEALVDGKGVQSLLQEASHSLDKAENWGNWDMWMNGGLISTHIKHEHIDTARGYIHSANRQMESFKKELEDLKRTIHVDIEIGATLTIADYFFDGLIADWLVQGKIVQAKTYTNNALRQIKPVVKQLSEEVSRVEMELEQLKQSRVSLIEQAKLL